MTRDPIGNWVEKAKSTNSEAAQGAGDDVQTNGVRVIRREESKSKGGMIMEIAEKIRPFLMNMFHGIRDEKGMLYQPAHVRGIALNMAQDLLKMHEDNSKNS